VLGHPRLVRFTVLASGSSGNATLITAGETAVLIDAGIAPRTIEERMRAILGRVVDLHAIVVTHAHGDHVGKLDACARHFDAPVWWTEPTARLAPPLAPDVRTHLYRRRGLFEIRDLRFLPFPVPHDAPQSALVVEHRYARAALVTDLGEVPPGLVDHLAGCQLLVLESNHDTALLHSGPYPDFLKYRIASRHGHLSNDQAASLIAQLGPETTEVVLAHLSQKCNSPERAISVARQAVRHTQTKLRVAEQDEPLDTVVRWSSSVKARMKTAQLALPL
jgi:phosphoribosyl 1,2-cyclic phosphodiesterase